MNNSAKTKQHSLNNIATSAKTTTKKNIATNASVPHLVALKTKLSALAVIMYAKVAQAKKWLMRTMKQLNTNARAYKIVVMKTIKPINRTIRKNYGIGCTTIVSFAKIFKVKIKKIFKKSIPQTKKLYSLSTRRNAQILNWIAKTTHKNEVGSMPIANTNTPTKKKSTLLKRKWFTSIFAFKKSIKIKEIYAATLLVKTSLTKKIFYSATVFVLLVINFLLISYIAVLKNYSPLELHYFKNSLLQNFYVQQVALGISNAKENSETYEEGESALNSITLIRKTASFIPGLNTYSLQKQLQPTKKSNEISTTANNASGKTDKNVTSAKLHPTQYGPLKTIIYEMQEGDNYWDISKKTDISIDTILSFNKIDTAHTATPGEIVFIPQRDGILHKRKNEENIDKIATLYSIEKSKLAFFNSDTSSSHYFIPDASFNFSQRQKLLGSEFFKPISNIRLTGFFGYRIHPITKTRTFHKGIDFGAPVGTPVYAAKGGRAVVAGTRSGYGLTVIIAHANGTRSLYAHLSAIFIKPGAQIKSQQKIGSVGTTGVSTGPHLHFEIHKNNKPVNPYPITEIFKN